MRILWAVLINLLRLLKVSDEQHVTFFLGSKIHTAKYTCFNTNKDDDVESCVFSHIISSIIF
jgi:hypothetical protein